MLAYRTVIGSRTSMCFVTSSPHAVRMQHKHRPVDAAHPVIRVVSGS